MTHRRTFAERWRYVRSRRSFTLLAFALLVLAIIAMLVARAFNAHLAFSAAGGVAILALLLTLAGLFIDSINHRAD